ncbi:type VII secretion-associated protein [Mycobacterium sp. WUMAC-067]|uniref:type VII secretion-associated protein n=2 Tax=unclassified Mycobacterium TaxID=2642494 RepID=UPI001CD9F28A|nr:type VII secretion-associated protein [Mycobacterium sp. WUMAC-067]MCA2243600.1 type VII secretion-associated protein [Mycobacterium sp. WUMAC-067]
MTEHRPVIEAGPGTVRRLCCGTGTIDEGETADAIRSALDAIDDRVALVGERPITVDALWEAALRSASCTSSDGMVVVHPSWWSSSRVGVLTAAAARVAGEVRTRPRSWLLAQAFRAQRPVTVEITERFVVITATEVTAVPRNADPQAVGEAVADVIADAAPAAVVIDTPSTVAGASALAALIADAVRGSGGTTRDVLQINDLRLTRLARAAFPARSAPPGPGSAARATARPSRVRTLGGLGAAAIVVAAAAPAAMSPSRPGEAPPKRVDAASTTYLVEGRVALSVPATWPTRRVVTGPGSARVQVTSPADPEVALHITQSPVAAETLSGTAERLKRAIDAEPAGLFVDFNPSGTSAGRPAVTYREVRAGHHVRWTVLLDGPVRISVGCQSRPDDEDAVRDACEQAVRTAHAIG